MLEAAHEFLTEYPGEVAYVAMMAGLVVLHVAGFEVARRITGGRAAGVEDDGSWHGDSRGGSADRNGGRSYDGS